MKENLKIEKELLFKTNIKDITSISLDREFNIEGDKIVGSFLINGEYKVHELSLNKDKFNFKIPFKYELKEDIDKDNINVEIENFIYDYNKDELRVSIEYVITGDKKDVLIFDDEESLDDFLKDREIEVVDTRVEEIKEIVEEKEELEEEKEILKCDLQDKKQEEVKEEDRKVIKDEEIKQEDKVDHNEIVNNINTVDDKFITYKIYRLNETDTLESIVIKYHTTIDELKEYNDLTNISSGDKIIIPYYE